MKLICYFIELPEDQQICNNISNNIFNLFLIVGMLKTENCFYIYFSYNKSLKFIYQKDIVIDFQQQGQ